MPSKKWLIALAIPLVVVYVFAFSYIYAEAYKIPEMDRDGSWLTTADIRIFPGPNLKQALSPEMVTWISETRDPRLKQALMMLRRAAENAVNRAHGEGLLIGILSLNIIWVWKLYRQRQRRKLAVLQTRAAAPKAPSGSPEPAVSRCARCGAVIGEGLSCCCECRSKEPA